MKIKIIIAIITVMVTLGCSSSDKSPLNNMTSPIIITQNDSVTQVTDKNGTVYILNVPERTNYMTSFMSVNDTLILNNNH